MYGASLLVGMTADALRAAIRAVGLLEELGRSSPSLPRGLVASNSVLPLGRELGRLRGLGDLLTPISTWSEIQVRADRLGSLFGMLPSTPTLLDAARNLNDPDTDTSVETCSAGSVERPPLFIMAATRGALVAAEEMHMRALDEKLRRQWGPLALTRAGQVQRALTLLHTESASWRGLEQSRLANRLIADHGFADTYGQAKKRARALVKEQASKGRTRPKPSDIRGFKRWNDALIVQLEALSGGQTLSSDLQQLSVQWRLLRRRLEQWLAAVRVRSALVRGGHWDDSAETRLDQLSAEILVSLQQSYGLNKSNYRALVESEIL